MISFAYILLGSNLGDTAFHLQEAINLIEKEQIKVVACSNVYKTKAWGNVNQDDFLNAVIKVETILSPSNLLNTLLRIELQMGRVRGEQKWMPRLIDLDILYYNNEIIQLPHLKVPHPYLAQRAFTLLPLNDIATNYMHPQLLQTTQEILETCTDKGAVQRIHLNLSISKPTSL